MKFSKIILSLFDDAGAGAEGGNTGGNQAANDAGSQNQNQDNNNANDAKSREKAFADLVKGEYKNEYQKATQTLIDRRFAKAKDIENQFAKQKPLLELLSMRYGESDPEKLLDLIKSDDAYYARVAEETGLSIEQSREFETMRLENNLYREKEQENERLRFEKEQAQKWYDESEELKQEYPEFDLMEELQSPAFQAQIKAGVPLKMAYQTAHFDELINSAKSKTEKAVVDNIKARGTRPSENGSKGGASFMQTKDISKFTKEDFEEYGRRAARGEHITFK